MAAERKNPGKVAIEDGQSSVAGSRDHVSQEAREPRVIGQPLPEPPILWEAYGVSPTDIEGWSFARDRIDDRGLGVPGAGVVAGLALTVLSPAEFTVRGGSVTVTGSPSWRESIRVVDDSRLVVRLPLVAREACRVLVLPPQEGMPLHAEPQMTAHTRAGQLQAVWQLTGREPFTVKAGQPLARVIAIAGGMSAETIEEDGFFLRVWRIHRHGVHICPAEKTLRGDASSAATRWCGPFSHANEYGFWVFSPVDLDVIWHGGRSFEHRLGTLYTDDDASVISRLQRPDDKYRYVPRRKIEFGSTLESVVSIWTGCIFETPPGWGLMIRNPVNINPSAIFRAQEAILETDWLPYDIWINLQFVQQGKWARLRRSERWPPIAQLLPVPKAAYDRRWRLMEQTLERTSPRGRDLYDRWIDYNYKKWVEKGQKEPTTYHRERFRGDKRADERSHRRTDSTFDE
jgi:hypothetical protein